MTLRRYCPHCGWECATESSAENDSRLALHRSIVHDDDEAVDALPKLEPIAPPAALRLLAAAFDLEPESWQVKHEHLDGDPMVVYTITHEDVSLLARLGISAE